MNLNQLTEKAVADQLGALVLENTKLKAVVQALGAELAALKAQAAGQEKPKANGEDHEVAELAGSAA